MNEQSVNIAMPVFAQIRSKGIEKLWSTSASSFFFFYIRNMLGSCKLAGQSQQLSESGRPWLRSGDRPLVSPARWCVWISSRPASARRDLRSLKATTGTASSSLPSPSCEDLVPTGSLTTCSMVPLCAGSVFSFGWASLGEGLPGTDFCVEEDLSI